MSKISKASHPDKASKIQDAGPVVEPGVLSTGGSPVPKDGSLNAPGTKAASHPVQTTNPKPGTGAAAPQSTTLPAKSNRGAGTVDIKNAADAVGSGVKPSNQPIPAGGASTHPAQTTSPKPGTGAAAVEPTSVTHNYVPGAGSPTQNRRKPGV